MFLSFYTFKVHSHFGYHSKSPAASFWKSVDKVSNILKWLGLLVLKDLNSQDPCLIWHRVATKYRNDKVNKWSMQWIHISSLPFSPGIPGCPNGPNLPGDPEVPFSPLAPGIPGRPGIPGKPTGPMDPVSPGEKEEFWLLPSYIKGNRGSERLAKLPKFTQLGSCSEVRSPGLWTLRVLEHGPGTKATQKRNWTPLLWVIKLEVMCHVKK